MSRPAHTCTQHQPGSPWCYRSHSCRCQPCLDAGHAYGKRQDAGANTRVPAPLIAAHLHRLTAAGMSDLGIAQQARLAPSTVVRIRTGKVRSVWRTTARALLATTAAPTIGMVPADGARRRLQALATLGWSSRAVTAATGLDDPMIRRIRRGAQPTVAAATAAAIRDLYDRHWDERRGDVRLVNHAARHGWLPPLAWDDGTGPHGIDNPNATPATARNRRTPTIDLIAELAEWGEVLPAITARLGLERDSIRQACIRAGRPDLWQRITREAA